MIPVHRACVNTAALPMAAAFARLGPPCGDDDEVEGTQGFGAGARGRGRGRRGSPWKPRTETEPSGRPTRVAYRSERVVPFSPDCL